MVAWYPTSYVLPGGGRTLVGGEDHLIQALSTSYAAEDNPMRASTRTSYVPARE